MILFVSAFIILLCVSAPITVALGGCALVYALVGDAAPITTLIQTIFGGLATFPLLAIPLFMLAGNLMNEGGLTPDLVRFARTLLGHINGGLGLATVLACAIFAAISGAAVATAVAIGVVMIPAMKKAGYDEGVAAALTSTASCLGPIIPPSIPFIIYGVTANVSIAGLFLGGVMPGLVLAGLLMVYIYFVARQERLPARPQDPGARDPDRRLEGAAGPVHAGPDHGRDPERDVHPDRGGRRHRALFGRDGHVLLPQADVQEPAQGAAGLRPRVRHGHAADRHVRALRVVRGGRPDPPDDRRLDLVRDLVALHDPLPGQHLPDPARHPDGDRPGAGHRHPDPGPHRGRGRRSTRSTWGS